MYASNIYGPIWKGVLLRYEHFQLLSLLGLFHKPISGLSEVFIKLYTSPGTQWIHRLLKLPYWMIYYHPLV